MDYSPMINGIVHRASLYRLGLSLLVLIVALGGLFLARNVYYNLFSGPFTVTPDYVLGISNVKTLTQYYITVTGEDAMDTGYQYISTRKGVETSHDSYVALLLGDRYLLVQKQGDAVEGVTKYTGTLVPMPSSVQREVINDMVRQYPKLDNVFLPFMLDTHAFGADAISVLVAGIIATAGGLWGLLGALLCLTNPSRHPIMRGLARFGDADMIINQIESELNQDHLGVHKIHLTRNWMITYTSRSFKAARLTDIVWLYQKVTQYRVNGIIPTGKLYTAMIWDKYSTNISVSGKDYQVLGILDSVAQRAPWAIIGYKPELKDAWRSDRQGFLMTVEQRRQKVAAH